jgi:hypothetical protein
MVVSMRSDPAFPQSDPVDNGYHPSYGKDRGMTLRDYFAAKAMQGLVENANWRGMPEHSLAKEAYKLADEMLKAREA